MTLQDDNPLGLPAAFIHTQQAVFGAAGADFVRGLPQLLASACTRWGLTLQPAFGLSFNYVAAAHQADGTPLVLKAGVTSNGELHSEMAALRAWNGHGAVRLIDSDPQAGLLLMERALPGRELAGLLLPHAGQSSSGQSTSVLAVGSPPPTLAQDEQATRIAASVMQRLWRPLSAGPLEAVTQEAGPLSAGALARDPIAAGHRFPTVAQWAAGLSRLRATFAGGTGPFPAALVSRAEGLFADLLASQGAPTLLHGDLHHWNLLSAEREDWLAIDPKGLIGEREYESGALLRNPTPMLAAWPNLTGILQRRVAVLAEMLAFDRQRLAAWGLAQAVLSSWWSYEDSLPHQPDWPSLAVAEALMPTGGAGRAADW